MKHDHKQDPVDDLETEDTESMSDWDSDDDKPYSDDVLDAFESSDDADYDGDSSFSLGGQRGSSNDGDEDFDSYFRNAESHARDRRRRARHRNPYWDERFDHGAYENSERDYSQRRRPRR